MFVRCGTLIDGTSAAPRRRVVIEARDGRVAAIRPDTDARPGDALDWSRFTVIPGLIDAHDHLTMDLGDEEVQSREPDGFTLLKGAGNARRILASGVTTLRDCGARRHFDLQLRDAIASGMISGPRVLASGIPLTVTGGQCWFLGGEVDSPAEIRRLVRQQAKAGADWIKVFVTGGAATKGSSMNRAAFSTEELGLIVEEAHGAGKRVVAHCHGGPGARYATEAGVDTIEHGAYFTRDDLQRMAERRIPLVITFNVFDRAQHSPDVPAFFREKSGDVMARYRETIALARELGVRIALGTDTVHQDLVAEMRALKAAGYSHAEALRAGTLGGAEALGLADLGTIEPGKLADLVAVEGDPLEDLEATSRIRGVIQGGVLVS